MSKDLDDLFHETLKYIYYAEKEIHSALPTLAKIARSDALRDTLENHKKETQDHITRLEDVFEIIASQRARRPVKLSRASSLSAWK